jgi:hypothetical protein
MGGWVGRYLLFNYYLHFYIHKLNFFLFWFSFLFDLTSQKDHFMVSQKNHQSSWTCSNWSHVKMLGFWFSFFIKLTIISSGWSCTSHILVLNSYVFIFESHNLVLFLIWKLKLNIFFSFCSCDSSYFWQMSYIRHKNFQKNIILNLLAYHIFLFRLFQGSCLCNCKS